MSPLSLDRGDISVIQNPWYHSNRCSQHLLKINTFNISTPCEWYVSQKWAVFLCLCSMKTPERWHPSRVVPSLSVSCPKVIKGCQDVTPWRHPMTMSYGVKWHGKMNLFNLHRSQHQKVWKSRFSTRWPSPLTYDLDLQTHPRCYQGQTSHQILGSYLKHFDRESAE